MGDGSCWYVVVKRQPTFRIRADSREAAEAQLVAVGIGPEKWAEAGLELRDSLRPDDYAPRGLYCDLADLDPMVARSNVSHMMGTGDLMEVAETLSGIIRDAEIAVRDGRKGVV